MRILVETLAKTEDPSSQLNILRGMNAAVKGKRDLPVPAGWEALYARLNASPNAEIRQQAEALAVVFGGGNAIAELRKVLADRNVDAARRRAALDSLVSAKDAGSLAAILAMAEEPGALRRPAIHALASFDSAKTPELLLAIYHTLSLDEKHEALATLVSRPAWARSIISGLDAKVIARSEVSTPLARQLQELADPEITAWLAKNWGAMRSSPADKQQQIARLKSVLTPVFMTKGDAAHGRALFSQTCALCHTLFGAGAKIGPELPGAFEDIDYLLLNIIDPNAIIGKDYQQTIIQTKDGQTLVGIIAEQDATSVTLKSLAGLQMVQRSDVATLTVLETSLMPEGLLGALKDEDVRDLFSYLRLHGQTPVLASASNINDFYNNVDLTRWIPSRVDGWRVENGEIIGRGNGERPEYLTSDMALENFKLKAQVRLTGDSASGAMYFRGQQTDGGFQGSAVRFGNTGLNLATFEVPAKSTVTACAEGLTMNPSDWTPIEVVAEGARVKVLVNGKTAIDLAQTPGGNRTVFSFEVDGKNAELRVKELHVELK